MVPEGLENTPFTNLKKYLGEAEDDDHQTGSDESEEDLEELPNGENGANGSAANDAANNLRYVPIIKVYSILKQGFSRSSIDTIRWY